jgi:hypothetical protein
VYKSCCGIQCLEYKGKCVIYFITCWLLMANGEECSEALLHRPVIRVTKLRGAFKTSSSSRITTGSRDLRLVNAQYGLYARGCQWTCLGIRMGPVLKHLVETVCNAIVTSYSGLKQRRCQQAVTRIPRNVVLNTYMRNLNRYSKTMEYSFLTPWWAPASAAPNITIAEVLGQGPR